MGTASVNISVSTTIVLCLENFVFLTYNINKILAALICIFPSNLKTCYGLAWLALNPDFVPLSLIAVDSAVVTVCATSTQGYFRCTLTTMRLSRLVVTGNERSKLLLLLANH